MMNVVDWIQVVIKAVALVVILAPFGGALKVDGTFPCFGIAVLCIMQQWQHRQRLSGSVKP